MAGIGRGSSGKFAARIRKSPIWRPASFPDGIGAGTDGDRGAAAGDGAVGAGYKQNIQPMKEGGLSLGQVADSVVMLDVICNRCGRRGCLSIARLVHEHGREVTMPALLDVLAADCPGRASSSLYQAFGAFFATPGAIPGAIPTRR